jgi:hypothetical protein
MKDKIIKEYNLCYLIRIQAFNKKDYLLIRLRFYRRRKKIISSLHFV